MRFLRPFRLAIIVILALSLSTVYGQKMKPEEVIAKHLDSIATAEKRAAMKTLVAVGDVKVTYITQKNQPAQGRVVLASSGPKLFLGMSLNASDYPQEKIIFDGKKTAVAFVRPGVRSILGNLIQSDDLMIEEGLLGGTLSTGWALMDQTERKAKVSWAGMKKLDGKEVYVLGYSPKGGSSFDIAMYFEKDTFRHIRTEYKRTSSASIGRTIDESARQSETRIKIVEDFSGHKDFQGMMIPHNYNLLYSISGANGTTEVSWTYELNEFAINQALDDKTFLADTK
ncbi:MAG: hypothetical protein ACT4O9_15840 [Blastocatellia bacterium]